MCLPDISYPRNVVSCFFFLCFADNIDGVLFSKCRHEYGVSWGFGTVKKINDEHTSQVVHQVGAYPGFNSMKRLGIFLHPLDGMLVHHRVTPSIKFAGIDLYIWVERGTLRVNCLAHEHNTMSPGRAWTQTARSGDVRTNLESTAPPTRGLGMNRLKLGTKDPGTIDLNVNNE